VLVEPDAAAEVQSTLNFEINRLAKSPLFLGCQFEGVLFDHLQLPAWGTRVVPEKFIVLKSPMESCWQINLPATWEEHLAVLYSSYRRKIKRCVDRVDQGELQLHHARQPQEWSRAFEILHSLHRARRAKIGDSGCFADHHFGTFLEQAIPAMMAKQQAHLSWLESQGSPIAIGLFLTAPSYIGMYQSGIEPSAMHLDPGHTLAACVIRESIRNGLHTFDFMRGDESYKSQWRAKPQPIATVNCIAPNTAARAFARVRDTLRSMKHHLKQWKAHNPSAAAADNVVTPVNTASRPAS
jgi:CelD/BcsL family acetyltransferase involved in cellulose biosynthesis